MVAQKYNKFNTVIPYNHSSASSSDKVAIVDSPNGSGKKIGIWRRATTPYIYAAEHNPATDTWTELTISGALADDFSYDRMLGYCSTNSTIYLFDNTRNSISQLYPFTLSGTTLTIGTPVDISAQVPNVTAAYEAKSTRMTWNGTYLYFMNSVTGALKRYEPNGATWSTLSSGWIYSRESDNWLFWYSDGNLYRYAYPRDTTTGSTKYPRFTKYNIAGDSWSDLTPIPLWRSDSPSIIQESSSGLGVLVDPNDDSVMYVVQQNLWFEYNTAADTWRYLGNGYGTSSFNAIGFGSSEVSKTALMSIADGYAWCYPGTGSYSHYVYFCGGNIISGTAFGTFPSAGKLKGIDISNFSNYDRPNDYLNDFLLISVDGGSYELMDMRDTAVPIESQNLNIVWTTSLKIKAFAINEPSGRILYEDNT